MANLIYTICIDSDKHICLRVCEQSIKNYAMRIGADYLVRNSAVDKYDNCINQESMVFQKFFIYELFKFYDRILYIDSDVLISNDAPDIFKEYPDESKLYALNESLAYDCEVDKFVEEMIAKKPVEWRKEGGHYVHYNSGVMLISKGQKEIFNFDQKEYFRIDSKPWWGEQAYINWQIQKQKIPMANIDKKFNAFVYYKAEGYFLHYSNVLDRDETILK